MNAFMGGWDLTILVCLELYFILTNLKFVVGLFNAIKGLVKVLMPL